MKAGMAVALAAAATLVPAASAEASSCGGYEDNGFFPNVGVLKVTNTTCSEGEDVAGGVDQGGGHSGFRPRHSVLSYTGRRFRCRYRLITRNDWTYNQVRCSSGRRFVTLRLYS